MPRLAISPVLVIAIALVPLTAIAENASGVEIAVGGGGSFAVGDGVLAPVLSARAGYRLGGFDLSGRFLWVFGSERTGNADSYDAPTSDAYSARAGMLEIGYRTETAVSLRVHGGAGLSSAVLLPSRSAYLAGVSHLAPAFELGLGATFWSKEPITISIEALALILTGLDLPAGQTTGYGDRDAHGPLAFGITALLSVRFFR